MSLADLVRFISCSLVLGILVEQCLLNCILELGVHISEVFGPQQCELSLSFLLP